MALDASGAQEAIVAASDSGTDSPPPLPSNRYRAIALAVGRTHNCVILDDHKVKCWGDNGSGQLGLGDATSRGADPSTMGDNLPTVDLGTGRTAKSLTAGRYATCVILDDDELKCWGVPFLAALHPELVTAGLIGAFPNQMGDNLKPIDLGAGRKPIAVAIGFQKTCAALDDGSFLCWSSPTTVPAPADGSRIVQLVHDGNTVGLFDDGSVRRISGAPGDPTPVDFGGRSATFLAGAATTGDFDCVVLRGGGTACTGSSLYAPAVPPTAEIVTIALTEYKHACGLDSAGVVTCWNVQAHPEWGAPSNGSTVHVPLGQPAIAVGAGDYNGCALLADGTVKCWAIDGTYALSLGGSVATSTGWPPVDLGTRPAP
jgi:alpha-tubulin suppressor-like RCC1 family protein